MKTESGLLNGLFNSFTDYYSAQTKYLRSQTLRRSADAAAEVSSLGSVALLGSFMLLFLSIGAAFWLGEKFLSYKWGFLTVGVFYLICFVLFLAFRKKIFGLPYRTRALRLITGEPADYSMLLEDVQKHKQEASVSEAELKKHVTELKELINQFQAQLNGLRQNSPQGDTVVKGPVSREVVSNVVSLILNTFVLRKAGLVKRTIIPIIANSLIAGSFKNEGSGNGFFASLKRRFFRQT